MAAKTTNTQPAITREDVIRLHQRADKLSADLVELIEIPARAASLQLERVETEWAVQQAELSLAAQGGVSLINHPGYRMADPVTYLASPVDLSDISDSVVSAAEKHALFSAKAITRIEADIAAVEKDISTCLKRMETIGELDANLATLRNKRRQAIACGEDAASFDTAIAEASAVCENKEQAQARLTDEAEGLTLRLNALFKALDAARFGQGSAEGVVKLARLCLLAAEYNQYAEKAADLFRQLFEAENSALALAEKMQTNGWQYGVPGVRHTSVGSPLYNVCNIPRLRLFWDKDDTAQEGGAYFYQNSENLAAVKNMFLRKNNL